MGYGLRSDDPGGKKLAKRFLPPSPPALPRLPSPHRLLVRQHLRLDHVRTINTQVMAANKFLPMHVEAAEQETSA